MSRPRPLAASAFLMSALMSALIAMMAGCAVTHVEPPPPDVAPAAFKETGLWQHAAPLADGPDAAAATVPAAWWTVFHDAQLNELQARLVVGNENLRSLAAQVTGAKAAVDASRQALWPSLSLGPSVTRSHSGNTGADGSSAAAGNSTRTSTTVSLGATASWEADLWGRLSEGTTQARATYLASAQDLAAARLSAQATLVQNYIAMRTAEAQLRLLTRTAEAYERSLALTQVRYEAGMAGRSDVLQAQTQLKATQADLAEARAQRAQLEHALAVLVGLPPSALDIAMGDGALPTTPAVPRLLPSTLLTRRPDVQAARHRVEAAYAALGIARAAYFPALDLSASAGWRHDTLAGLVSAPHLFWSIGPSLTAAILDGGQRQLAIAQARSGADQATATYRQACLDALQEVEDSLVLADALRQEVGALEEALGHARQNLDIVSAQYQAGTVSYLNVVVAQTSALDSERSLLQARNRQLAAVALLLKNIGGAWGSPAGPDAAR